MKISLEWLREYLPGELKAERAGEALTMGGLPVEVFEKHGDDDVVDVEVTSNRGDCLSHVGVARELGALLARESKSPTTAVKESSSPASSAVSVAIEAPALCPHYTARVIKGVKVGPSPAWMRRRLEAVGLRSINNVVDVTNYVMFELGQPLHAFDFDEVGGSRIVVREARKGEKLVSIDGHERELTPGMLVIADAEKPVALAGVMGGRDSEVNEGTVNVLLESARFDALSVRRTARALQMMSDSSYRFERQIDPTLPERASARAAQLILETAGGELLSGIVQAGSAGYSPKKLSLRMAKLRAVTGIEWKTDEVVDALKRLGFQVSEGGPHPDPLPGYRERGNGGEGVIDVVAPSWRLDVNIEVDLVEEVARVLGYDRIPMKEEISIRLTPRSAEAATMDLIRGVLVGAGYYESITFSFVSDTLADDFVPSEAKALVKTDNVKWRSDNRLRPSLLPGLLESVRRNEMNGTAGARLFEIGGTFWGDASGKVDERRRVGLVGGGEYREARGTVEELLSRVNRDRAVRIVPEDRKGYARGACGRIEWGGEAVGYVGRTDRAVAEKLGLRELPAAAEIELAPLLEHAQHVPQQRGLPKYPAVRRDLSFVVAEKVQYDELLAVVEALKLPDLVGIEHVTTYRGKPLEKGQKSLSIRLVFRSAEKTLTSEEVESRVQGVAKGADANVGAKLRV